MRIKFSSRGQIVSSRSDASFVLLDSDTGQCLCQGHANLRATTFSPDGQFLATCSITFTEDQAMITIWDTQSGNVCNQIYVEEAASTLTSAEFIFFPNSEIFISLLMSLRKDGTMDLWDLRTSKYISTIPYQSRQPRIKFWNGSDLMFVDSTAYSISSGIVAKADVSAFKHLVSELQIDSSGEWVTKAAERVLWLPPEYRPSESNYSEYRKPAYDVFGNKIIIGSRCGRWKSSLRDFRNIPEATRSNRSQTSKCLVTAPA